MADRWSQWLRSQLLDAALSAERTAGPAPGGLDDAGAWEDRVRPFVTKLATACATDPTDRDTAPRGDVWKWLRDRRYISPERCFGVSQALGEIGVAPVPGGALGLLAAGHAAEALDVLFALFEEGIFASAEVLHEPPAAPKVRSKKDVAKGEALVAYVVRFLGCAFTALSDIDEIYGITNEERAAARLALGDAPIVALERAWERAQATELPINVRLDPFAVEHDGPHRAALVAFNGFAELVAQHGAPRSERLRELWKTNSAAWDAYRDRAHAEMPLLLVGPRVRKRGGPRK